MSAQGITIVGASAGSGKTFRLTREVTEAVDPKASNPVDLEGLVAVTFTRKAHAELAARIRHKLVESGAYGRAMQLPLAYLGTVHAACLRWLQEFALDAGLSPNVDVVGQDQKKLLRQALESELPASVRERLEHLAARVELRVNQQTHRFDWQTPVADIMDLARANRIPADQLPKMAERSAAGLLGLLGTPLADASVIDDALRRDLDQAIKTLVQLDDGVGQTKTAIVQLEEAKARLEDGELAWSDWLKLSKIKASKARNGDLETLRLTAARYGEHPRLHSDLRALTEAVFEAARVGLSAYQEWKLRRRVVDYVDMLDRALDLLEHPRVREELGRRLQLVVVDEFQDTSPIQLALFVRLHALAGRSLWVGDRKQCIFEYAGADPALMDSVAEWIDASGGARERLDGNYRSRSELVKMCSELFTLALEKHGFVRDEVAVVPQRKEVEGIATLPPLGLFVMETKNNSEDAEAIAEGVRRILAAPAETRVVDRETEKLRDVRPGDIAILVTTNEAANKVANSLHTRGIRAAIARAGLLSTPEGELTDAALRWLLDEGDSLAAATIDALCGFDGKDPNEWLAERIRATDPTVSVPESPWRTTLSALRPKLGMLSPCEALDAVHERLDVVALCSRWPDPAQRIANLDALRALAATYEQRCAQEHEGGTVAGLLRYFDDVQEKHLARDEMLASDDQYVPTDDGAVVVCTYHKAKGLEWPVVVMANLDRGERAWAFDVSPETDQSAFNPGKPLEGRWIRYWPWPFGGSSTGPLADRAAQSPEGVRVALREKKERARLLYVGFTRARDHLVLAVRAKRNAKGEVKVEKEWLDSLTSADGAALIALPIDGADGALAQTSIGGSVNVPTRVMRMAGAASAMTSEADQAPWFARPTGTRVARLPYFDLPSEAEAIEGQSVTIGAVERLSSAVVVEGHSYEYDVLGTAVHAFLAADVEGLAQDERLNRARRLLSAASLTGVISPESLVRSGDAFREWVNRKWPGATWRRELFVDAFLSTPQGERRVRGYIDLLLETPAGAIIVDHKTFPGTTEASWRMKAVEHAPQLAAYADVLSRVERMIVKERWLHFPLGGGLVAIT